MAAKSERFELRIDEEQLARVDEWASEQPDQPTRAEAVRRLVNLGLSAGSSRAVHFSDGEKMLILMMGDLFKALKIKDPESNPDFLAQVIYGGHYWAPKWDMQGVFHDHVDNPRDVSYVVDVLDMWSFIEEAYERLNSEQKAAIAAEVDEWATDVKFHGFDGNNECGQMSIAGFLVNKMGRFSRFKGRDLNSHCQTEGRYRRMITAFEPMRASLVGGGLNVQQLVTLLKR
ncbi:MULTISPECIES: YfbU family protein [Betaproteobacteria]|jgi:uncharacterized protein YfbU (UPF0304 family)|uniref:YfbU family protein n=2 Tax=root TaxID=1 RepID=D5X723_THIK1|nr:MULTISPECIES: YfbU family protein [Betaproteobacteria]OZB55136.1 MAG: hypothetical protein B7X43_01690 [Thiomonas sp. 15-63-373]OZB69360.1 MAG: hypothetical protein B7X30_13330 [Thiomonas sp. 13-64-67]